MAQSYYNEYKDMEQRFMVLQDRYQEVARALGFEGDGFWGDVHVMHERIVSCASRYRAREVERGKR